MQDAASNSADSPKQESKHEKLLAPLRNSPNNVMSITPSIKLLKGLSKLELMSLLNDCQLLSILEPIFHNMLKISDPKHVLNVCELLKVLPVSLSNLKSSTLLKTIMVEKKSAKNFQLKKQLNTIVAQWKSSVRSLQTASKSPSKTIESNTDLSNDGSSSPPVASVPVKRKFSETSMAKKAGHTKRKKRIKWASSLESVRVFEVNRNPVRVLQEDWYNPPLLSLSSSFTPVSTNESKKFPGPLRAPPKNRPLSSSPSEPPSKEPPYAESDVPTFPTSHVSSSSVPSSTTPSAVSASSSSSTPSSSAAMGSQPSSSMSSFPSMSVPSNVYQQLQQHQPSYYAPPSMHQHLLHHPHQQQQQQHLLHQPPMISNYGPQSSSYLPPPHHQLSQQQQQQPPYGFPQPSFQPPSNPYGFQSPSQPMLPSQSNNNNAAAAFMGGGYPPYTSPSPVGGGTSNPYGPPSVNPYGSSPSSTTSNPYAFPPS